MIRRAFGSLQFLRRFSSQPDDAPIILNAMQAGLVRDRRRKSPRRQAVLNHRQSHGILPMTPLDLSDFKVSSLEPVVSAIHSHRPESAGITQQRFNDLREELKRGFKKNQLEEYLKAQMTPPSKYKRLNKEKLANFILSEIWNCFVRVGDGGVFVENVLELSEQDFVLVLGGQGRLLREWSKSGARISIWPSRHQIIVNSTEETYDWISASLSKFLESEIATEVNVAELKKLDDPAQHPGVLSAIQQLTDTYFGGISPLSDSFTVFSAGHGRFSNMNLVKRLLLHFATRSVSAKWRPSLWYYDAKMENHDRYFLHPFDDSDSLEWVERMNQWTRWEEVKRKNKDKADDDAEDVQLQVLAKPQFNDSRETPLTGNLQSQLEQIVKSLLDAHPRPAAPADSESGVSTTLTVTPGYILHQSDENTKLPHAGMERTFCSNIPAVNNVASTLPLYAKDTKHELAPKSPTTLGDDLWMDILKLDAKTDETGKRVFTARHKDLDLESNLRLVQIKFIANPNEGLSLKYPPIEAWASLPVTNPSSSSQLEELPRLIAVPLESSAYVSLPKKKADLKVTLAHSFPVNITAEVETYFMKRCRFGRLGPIHIEPELVVEIGGERVSYLYQSSTYVTLAELKLNDTLLQLSQVEGGKLGGRKLEANVVTHAEDTQLLNPADASKTADEALSFTSMM